jgi:hypothetical protein
MRNRLLPILLCLAACRTQLQEPDGGAGGASFTTIEDFYSSYASASCGHHARCGLIARSQIADCTAAVRAILDGSEGYSVSAAIEAGRLVFDAGHATACVAAWGSLGCDPRLDRSVFIDGICAAVTHGAQTPGDPCRDSVECRDGYCDRGFASPGLHCSGTCKPYLPVGAACVEYAEGCSPGSSCVDRQCTLQNDKTGISCATSADCQSSSFVCLEGACTRPLPDLGGGAPCFGPGSCAAGYYCGGGKTGTVCLPLLPVGAACTGDGQCVDGAFCAQAMDAPRCTAFAEIGAACDPTATPTVCTGDSFCDSGSARCVLKHPAGAPCESNLDCTGLLGHDALCESRHCQTERACRNDRDCAGFGGQCDPASSLCRIACGT